MIIYPAIDLRFGKCIRLYQGDYARETIYSNDPLMMVNEFIAEGAEWIHIVDLDGAKDPLLNQRDLIIRLIQSAPVKVQTGGGIRDKATIKTLLDSGVARVIIGSLSVTKPNEVREWFKFFNEDHLCLALDIQPNKKVAMNAWQSVSDKSIFDLIHFYKEAGLKHILCTSIALDGTLQGPDFALYESLNLQFPFLNIQASGGIHALTDIQKLKKMGLAGGILGRALYEKEFTLKDALSC